jgi:hypothetical protein
MLCTRVLSQLRRLIVSTTRLLLFEGLASISYKILQLVKPLNFE